MQHSVAPGQWLFCDFQTVDFRSDRHGCGHVGSGTWEAMWRCSPRVQRRHSCNYAGDQFRFGRHRRACADKILQHSLSCWKLGKYMCVIENGKACTFWASGVSLSSGILAHIYGILGACLFFLWGNSGCLFSYVVFSTAKCQYNPLFVSVSWPKDKSVSASYIIYKPIEKSCRKRSFALISTLNSAFVPFSPIKKRKGKPGSALPFIKAEESLSLSFVQLWRPMPLVTTGSPYPSG